MFNIKTNKQLTKIVHAQDDLIKIQKDQIANGDKIQELQAGQIDIYKCLTTYHEKLIEDLTNEVMKLKSELRLTYKANEVIQNRLDESKFETDTEQAKPKKVVKKKKEEM